MLSFIVQASVDTLQAGGFWITEVDLISQLWDDPFPPGNGNDMVSRVFFGPVYAHRRRIKLVGISFPLSRGVG